VRLGTQEHARAPGYGPNLELGRDGVLQDQCVTGDDGDHHPDWPVGSRVAGSDVFGYWCPGRYSESGYLARCGHAGDDLVYVVGLLVASLGEDVLSRGVLGLGQLSAFDNALVEIVIGNNGWFAVDVAVGVLLPRGPA
jgi:hypothetical protein